MRKIILLAIIVLGSFSNLNAEEIKRITVGNKDAKITIIAFEFLNVLGKQTLNNSFPTK